MIHYIFQVVVFQLLFLLLYELLLRKQTFFNWNRIYLLFTSMLSILLPFMKLQLFSQYTVSYGVLQLPELVLGTSENISEMTRSAMDSAGIQVQQAATPAWELVVSAGAGIAALWFVLKTLRLLLLRLQNPGRWCQNAFIVSLKNSLQAFSFFNTIFIGNQIRAQEKEVILEHEMVHVRHWHSLDVVWFELFRIIFWFNPCVYWYQNRITELHEFIADREVLNNTEKTTYYTSLIQQLFQIQAMPLANAFFSKSLIKKRIMMLKQHPSKSSGLWRYLLIVPLALSMLVYVACEKEVMTKDNFNLADDTEHFAFDIERGEALEALTQNESYAKMQEFIDNQPAYVIQMTVSGLTEPLKLSLVRKTELPEGALELRTTDGAGTYYLVADFITSKTDIELLPSTDHNVEVPFSVIDQAPIFESCSHLFGQDQKNCTSMEIAKFVNQNFNVELSTQLGLVGRQRIFVMFKIDKKGMITDVAARAPHPALEDEAERIISSLPQFIPGEHRGEKVVVPYSLPIIFQINE